MPQSRLQVCPGLQNHCRVPLFRQAPEQWRCGAFSGSTKVPFASGERAGPCAWTVDACDVHATRTRKAAHAFAVCAVTGIQWLIRQQTAPRKPPATAAREFWLQRSEALPRLGQPLISPADTCREGLFFPNRYAVRMCCPACKRQKSYSFLAQSHIALLASNRLAFRKILPSNSQAILSMKKHL